VASLVSALLATAGAIVLAVRGSSLAADAHRRDDQLSEHDFQLMFDVMAVVIVVVAALAALAVWALWRRQRWAWWFLVVLSALGCLSVFRARSALVTLNELPIVVGLVALLMPTARAFLRREPTMPRGEPDGEPWAAQPPSYVSGDDWLQGR
jgi:hypothetical protein